MDSLSQTTMGLSILDSSVACVTKANCTPKLSAGDGGSSLLNTAGSPESPPAKNCKTEDLDEASSGYSSRESQCGDGPALSHSQRPQRSSKNSVLGKDSTKACSIIQNVSAAVQNNTREEIGQRVNSDACLFSEKSEPRRKTFLRQFRVDPSDETEDINTTESTNEIFRALRTEKNEQHSKGKTYRTVEVQTEDYETDSDLVKILVETNADLEKKLKNTNIRCESLIENLESQLVSAVTEVSRLLAQLRLVDQEQTQPFSCSKCGYHSEGDISETQSGSTWNSPSNATIRKATIRKATIRKATSMDSLPHLSNSSTSNASSANPVRFILKGQNPTDMKQALLQRNKILRDEIETLKTSKPPFRAASASSLSAKLPTAVSSPRGKVNSDVAKNQEIKDESEVLVRRRSKQRFVEDEARWKQTVRGAGKHYKATGNGSQSTSRAFRTINVKTWGQTT